MKEKDSLNKLFEHARSEKPIIKSDQVEKLLRSGKKVSAKKIKLGTSGRGLFNPLNLIIMISTIAIITAFFTIFSGNPEEPSKASQIKKIQETLIKSTGLNPEAGNDQASNKKNNNSKEEPKNLGAPVIKPEVLIPAELGELLNGDTLIRGEVLHLTKEELSRLGFLFNMDGFFYLNKVEQGYMNFYSDKDPESKLEGWSSTFGVGKKPINQKKDITEFSFYPARITGTGGEQLHDYSTGVSTASRYSKDFYDDLSVPVYFPGRWFADENTGDRIIWFHVTEDFFTLLPLEKVDATKNRIELVEKLHEISRNETGNFVNYELPGLNIKKVNPILLRGNSIGDLGLKLSQNGIVYRYQFEDSYVTLGLYDEGSSFKSSANAEAQELRFDRDYDTPMLGATKLNGEYSVGISVEFYPEITDSVDFFSNIHDVSVPIRFVDDSLPEVVRNTIFWYFPTEEFFECLPDSIGIPMAKEYNLNVAPKLRGSDINSNSLVVITGVLMAEKEQKSTSEEAIPCEYFPSFCEGLPGLDMLNIYPNPASDMINVEVTISRGKSLDYRVFDLSGRLMIDDVETKEYQDAGLYKQQIDVSSLKEGFYLLVLTDEKGAKMTRRVIKK